jgi:hypothetical protein
MQTRSSLQPRSSYCRVQRGTGPSGSELAQECTPWRRERVSARSLALLLFYAGGLELSRGNRPHAEELWNQVAALAERTHVVSARLYAQHRDVILSIIDGDFETAFGQLEHFVRFGDESGR